jgi:hypothetical protein
MRPRSPRGPLRWLEGVNLARVFAVTRTENADGTPRLHVAVWTSSEDRTLLAAESFGSVFDMTGWLRTRAQAEPEPPTIVWTDDLRADPALARAVSEGLGVPLPPRPRRRGRRAADAPSR